MINSGNISAVAKGDILNVWHQWPAQEPIDEVLFSSIIEACIRASTPGNILVLSINMGTMIRHWLIFFRWVETSSQDKAQGFEALSRHIAVKMDYDVVIIERDHMNVGEQA